jgi:hypothetical protein
MMLGLRGPDSFFTSFKSLRHPHLDGMQLPVTTAGVV